MSRTKLCIIISIGYIKLKCFYFVMKLVNDDTAAGSQDTLTDQLRLVRLEQERRVRHIRDVCHHWADKASRQRKENKKLWEFPFRTFT